MSQTFEAPPRLAIGSHPGNTVYMCGMNVISWENGDTKITDYPTCSPKPLARMVQAINDGYCNHVISEVDYEGDVFSVLCAPCSIEVLRLAHRTVGQPRLTLGEGWQWVAAMFKDATDEHLKAHGDNEAHQLARWALQAALTMADGHPPERAPMALVPGEPYPILTRHIYTFVRQFHYSPALLEHFASSATNLIHEAGMFFATRKNGLAKITEAHRVIDMWNSIAASRPKAASEVREEVAA